MGASPALLVLLLVSAADALTGRRSLAAEPSGGCPILPVAAGSLPAPPAGQQSTSTQWAGARRRQPGVLGQIPAGAATAAAKCAEPHTSPSPTLAQAPPAVPTPHSCAVSGTHVHCCMPRGVHVPPQHNRATAPCVLPFLPAGVVPPLDPQAASPDALVCAAAVWTMALLWRVLEALRGRGRQRHSPLCLPASCRPQLTREDLFTPGSAVTVTNWLGSCMRRCAGARWACELAVGPSRAAAAAAAGTCPSVRRTLNQGPPLPPGLPASCLPAETGELETPPAWVKPAGLTWPPSIQTNALDLAFVFNMRCGAWRKRVAHRGAGGNNCCCPPGARTPAAGTHPCCACALILHACRRHRPGAAPPAPPPAACPTCCG